MTKIVTIVAAAFTFALLSIAAPTGAQAQYRGYGYGGYGYNGYYGGYAYRPYYAPRYYGGYYYPGSRDSLYNCTYC